MCQALDHKQYETVIPEKGTRDKSLMIAQLSNWGQNLTTMQ